jgi:hypothetical protein
MYRDDDEAAAARIVALAAAIDGHRHARGALLRQVRRLNAQLARARAARRRLRHPWGRLVPRSLTEVTVACALAATLATIALGLLLAVLGVVWVLASA